MKDYNHVNYYTKKKFTFNTLKLFMARFNCFLQGVVSHLLYLSCTFFHGLRLRKWEDSLRKKKGEKNVEKLKKNKI